MKPAHEPAEGGARRFADADPLDVRMVEVELAGGGMVAVALLGHGEW